MARKLQIKRGRKANMPALAEGELGFATDEKKGLYWDGVRMSLYPQLPRQTLGWVMLTTRLMQISQCLRRCRRR